MGKFKETFKETFNFDDIGGKIKDSAKWSCWISIIVVWIASVIAFIVCFSDENKIVFFWVPIVAAFICPFGIWMSYWTLYAFGELVQRAISVDSRLYYIGKELEAKSETPSSKSQPEEKTTDETVVNKTPSRVNTPEELGTCEMCGKENVLVYNCHYENQYGKYTREMCADCMKEYNATRV